MLSNLFRDKLQTIVNDDLLISAIRAIFEERTEQERPKEWDEDNAGLGEKYRAYLRAKQIIDKSFVDLLSLKLLAKQIKTFNKEK